jgi:YopX protein
MSREIKFRGWDEGFKRFIYFDPFGDDFEDDVLWLFWDGDYPTSQYTGLKDKNGVEIYEGDILQFPDGPYKKMFSVKWNSFLAGFNQWRNHDKVKVVGNIYENPELLENGEED